LDGKKEARGEAFKGNRFRRKKPSYSFFFTPLLPLNPVLTCLVCTSLVSSSQLILSCSISLFIQGVAVTKRTNRSAFGMTLEVRGCYDFRKLPNRQYYFLSLFIINNNKFNSKNTASVE
jgi:hypothetical protein